MKLNIITLVISMLTTVGLLAQNSKQKPWNNHYNYKDEIIQNIKKTPLPILPQKRNHTTYGRKGGKEILDSFSDFEFVNGINIAWVNFGRDIGLQVDPGNQKEYHPDIAKFTEIFDRVSESGGNVIRWWFHTNGSTSPIFDANDEFVIENPSFFETDLVTLLDLAVAKNVKIQVCLWSFDMLKGGQWRVNSARNKKMLTSDTHLQAYIDNSLIPIVNAVGNHPGLYAWELFNEPEGLTTEYANHWPDFTDKVSIVDVQKTVNKLASAIRQAQPNVKITNGALGFLSGIDNASLNFINNYTDIELKDKGGKEDGYLDFYNIHYYDWAGENGSPFHNNFIDQNLDKPTIIAEYYPEDTFSVASLDLGSTLFYKGWHGSLVWSWTDRGWNAMKPIVEEIENVLSDFEPTLSNTLNSNTSSGTSNQFFIENKQTGFKIRPANRNIRSTIIQVEATANDDFVRWERVDANNGYFYLKNVATGMYFRPPTGEDGAILEQRPTSFSGSLTQWKQVNTNDDFFYLQNRGTGMYFRPRSSAVNTTLVQRPTNYRGNFTQWIFQNVQQAKTLLSGLKEDVIAYPNPIRKDEILELNLSSMDSNLIVRLQDLKGSNIYTKPINSIDDLYVDMSLLNIDYSLHILQVIKNDKVIHTEKVIVK